MVVYKLTDAEDNTGAKHIPTHWTAGYHAPVLSGGKSLCSDAWYHAYRDPVLAVMMDPIHGRYGSVAHMWEMEGEIGADDGTKIGCRTLRAIRRIEMPPVTVTQRVRFGILAAMTVFHDCRWRQWAEDWLNGANRNAAYAADAAAAYAAAAYAAAVPIDLVKIAHHAMAEDVV